MGIAEQIWWLFKVVDSLYKVCRFLNGHCRKVIVALIMHFSCCYCCGEMAIVEGLTHNRPFPSSLVPLFQNECKCETFLMKMSSACSFIFMQIKVVFIRIVSHLDSLWNRGTRELGNGLLYVMFHHLVSLALKSPIGEVVNFFLIHVGLTAWTLRVAVLGRWLLVKVWL